MKVKEDTTGIPTRRRRGKPSADSYKTAEDLTDRIRAYCDNRVKGFSSKMAGLLIEPQAGEQQVEVWENTPGVQEYLAQHGMTQKQIEESQQNTYMELFWTVNESALREMNRRINSKEEVVKVISDDKLYQIIKDGLNVRVAIAAREGGSAEGEKDQITDEAVRTLLPESTKDNQ